MLKFLLFAFSISALNMFLGKDNLHIVIFQNYCWVGQSYVGRIVLLICVLNLTVIVI